MPRTEEKRIDFETFVRLKSSDECQRVACYLIPLYRTCDAQSCPLWASLDDVGECEQCERLGTYLKNIRVENERLWRRVQQAEGKLVVVTTENRMSQKEFEREYQGEFVSDPDEPPKYTKAPAAKPHEGGMYSKCAHDWRPYGDSGKKLFCFKCELVGGSHLIQTPDDPAAGEDGNQ